METGTIIAVVLGLIILVAIGSLFVAPSLFAKPLIKPDNSQESTNGLKAPELQGISGYINTPPGLKISDFIGKKVILVDFWTYTCINCVRTLPYLKQWDEKYRDDGLLIIGVHTPEFDFEKEYDNVKKAVSEHGLKYPIVQDNEYGTWRAYQNRFWPAKYLIDKNGNIVYTHFGEGNYNETEKKIQELLEDLNKKNISEKIGEEVTAEQIDFTKVGTPEIYFGYAFRRAPIGNAPFDLQPDAITAFTLPQQQAVNVPYLEGNWKNNADNFELTGDTGKIVLIYKAKSVNIVAGSENGSTLDVTASNQKQAGNSVKDFTMYRVADGTNYDPKVIEITVQGKGFKINTFTFG